MEQNSSKGENSRKTATYTGSALAIGAAIGMIWDEANRVHDIMINTVLPESCRP